MLKKKNKTDAIGIAVLLAAVFIFDILAEMFIPQTSLLFSVIRKSCVYALVAVSMNLLNGFTGLFSLGQAGFMLIGAYVYAMFTIPTEMRESVYQYFDGGLINFTIPWPIAIVIAGAAAAVFAFLIGLPVLRLKSDYLAIATLGFAEIIRSFVMWDKLGPLTNGSNVLIPLVHLNCRGSFRHAQIFVNNRSCNHVHLHSDDYSHAQLDLRQSV